MQGHLSTSTTASPTQTRDTSTPECRIARALSCENGASKAPDSLTRHGTHEGSSLRASSRAKSPSRGEASEACCSAMAARMCPSCWGAGID